MKMQQAAKFTRVVPWFSMSEWKTVYELIYSTNPREQKDGLDRLVCWKARCPSLPAAVECTLGIFQVLLEDPEHLSGVRVSISREQQLRLMYSTAVMRFLNLMVEVKTDEDLLGSMYTRAGKLSIPEWIVNLRHDAAHGTSLPDLSLLRAAAIFISKWLHEHYWEHETEVIQDWYVSEGDIKALSVDEKKLGRIMEAWEALSLYQLAGFENMRQIPDNELKSSIVSIHKMLGEDDNPYGMKHNSPAKVANVLALVLKRLTRFFKTKTTTLEKASLLADILVDGDFLLPVQSLIKILYPNGSETTDTLEHLPTALVDCCEDMISTLWDVGAIPALVTKLISFTSDETGTNLRRNMAALWAQKLLLSCLKVREARKVRFAIRDRLDCKAIYDQYKNSIPGANRNTVITSLAFAAVENQRNDLKLGYTWKVSPIPTVLTDGFLLKQSVLNPSKFSSIFLPCLMELVVPAIPLETRTLLLDLIKLYCNNGSDEVTNQRTFTVSDLPCYSHLESLTTSENGQSASGRGNSELEPQSRWSLSQGHLEWHKCPLGTLPWFQEHHHLEQEEYEDKHRQSTRPKLFIQSEWAPFTNTVGIKLESQNSDQDLLHKVKTGRVVKPLSTPMRMLKIFKQSPKQKALNFLTGV